jgi:hypothetical protein
MLNMEPAKPIASKRQMPKRCLNLSDFVAVNDDVHVSWAPYSGALLASQNQRSQTAPKDDSAEPRFAKSCGDRADRRAPGGLTHREIDEITTESAYECRPLLVNEH